MIKTIAYLIPVFFFHSDDSNDEHLMNIECLDQESSLSFPKYPTILISNNDSL